MQQVSPAAPERSLEQRMSALRRANEIRMARARLKRAVAAGVVQIADVLDDPPEYAASMRVGELLLAMPAVGPTKVHQVLVKAQVSPSKTLAGLTARQRRDVMARLWAMPSIARRLAA